MDGTNRLKENTLSVNVFTAPGKAMVGERPKPFGEALGFDPITSTLIFGEYDAVLVDAMGTVAEAEALANWVALHKLRSREIDSISERRTNDNKGKSLGASFERSRFAIERWQGLCRRWLLSQRTDGSGSRLDEGRLRNHFRQPQRQYPANGCPFSCRRFLRRGRG